MLLLLVAAGGLYLAVGDLQEALILLASVFVVISITLYQERKTERALDALRDLSSPRALVVRDGVQHRIPGREVVRGDVLLLAEGDRVPVTWSSTSVRGRSPFSGSRCSSPSGTRIGWRRGGAAPCEQVGTSREHAPATSTVD
jgi:hypothetical protein